MLLLGGVIFSAEYYLRTNEEASAKLLKKADRDAGWKPSETMYLLSPASRTVKQFSDSGKLIDVRYDENGFRIGRAAPTQKNHILFLGDECTLATNVEAEQTFIAAWQKKQDQHLQQFSLRSGRFINAAQPDGCPLLWLLQDPSRFGRTSVQFVLCVLTPQSFENDFRVRRTVTFDEQGIPISGNHPYVRPVESKQPTQFDSLFQSQLVKLGLPVLRELFLGGGVPADQAPLLKSFGTDLISSTEQEFLALLALEPLIELRKSIRSRGGKMILVYLSDVKEIAKLQREKSTKKLPFMLATDSRRAVISEETWNYHDVVRNYAIKHQIRFCDTSVFFNQQQSPEEYFSKDGIRLSLKGHQKIAELLMEYFSAKTAGSQPKTKK